MAGPIENRDRRGLRDTAPILPTMKIREPVSAHQPDERRMRIKRLQCVQRIAGILQTVAAFEIAHDNVFVIADNARQPQAVVIRRVACRVL